MVEEIAFENGQISNLEGLVTLTLDRVILLSHAPLIDLYQILPKSRNFLWTEGRTDIWDRLYNVDTVGEST